VKTVLVTGGSGFLGRRLQKVKPKWIYLSSKECDLTAPSQVQKLFKEVKPDAVVHLASMVGGIKENVDKQADFCYCNSMINTNVLHQAHLSGVDRILSSLSTCAFPDKLGAYPFTEADMFKGPPSKTNFSYGMSKRMLHVASVSYRKQYGRNYSTFSPCNIYGPGDKFGEESSHFVASLVHKCANTKDGGRVPFWGTGKPVRQQLYVDDMAQIIVMLLSKHNTEAPLIVSPAQSYTIREMVDIGFSVSGKKVETTFDGLLDGQFRKDGCNKALLQLIGKFDFTTFEEGFRRTYESYTK